MVVLVTTLLITLWIVPLAIEFGDAVRKRDWGTERLGSVWLMPILLSIVMS